jgi:hypothetical protein
MVTIGQELEWSLLHLWRSVSLFLQEIALPTTQGTRGLKLESIVLGEALQLLNHEAALHTPSTC